MSSGHTADWMEGLPIDAPTTELAERIDRTQRIVSLLRLGTSYHRITEILRAGVDCEPPQPIERISLGVVASVCRRHLRYIAEEVQNDATEARALELMQLDGLQAAFQGKAEEGNKSAAEMVLKIMARRDRLMGTEAATQVNVNVNGDILHALATDPAAIEAERQAALAGFGNPRARVRVLEGEAIERG